MSKNVSQSTITLSREEVDMLWDDFVLSVKKYASEHFVRTGQMTQEEVESKVKCEAPIVSFLHLNGFTYVEAIEVDVDVSLD